MYTDIGNSVPIDIYNDLTVYLGSIAHDMDKDKSGDFDGCFISRISFRGFKLELDEESCFWELV